MNDYTVNKDKLTASICRDSYYQFVRQMWDTVVAEDPIWNWHIKYICDELQTAVERVIKREQKEHDIVINVPPASSKSLLTSVMLTPWIWTKDPSISIIGASYAKDLSLDLSRKSRLIIESEKYKRLFPEVHLSSDQNVKSHFETDKKGARISTSVGAAITGFHAHILLIDDPLNPLEARSDAKIETANDWIQGTLTSRRKVADSTITILIMQRLHQNDCTAMFLNTSKGKVKHIRLPAELNQGIDPEPKTLKKNYKEGLLDPIRLGADVLKEYQSKLGIFSYTGQYIQDPVPKGGVMFNVDKLRIVENVPRFTKIIRYFDKAGTIGTGCYTVGVKLGKGTDNVYYILDVIRGQWEAATRERIIDETAKRDGDGVMIAVEMEPGSGGKESAEATALRLSEQGFVCRTDRPTGSKELRADVFAVQVNNDNVRLLRGDWNNAFIDELRYFPASTYKDQVDSASGAYKMISQAGVIVGALMSNSRTAKKQLRTMNAFTETDVPIDYKDAIKEMNDLKVSYL